MKWRLALRSYPQGNILLEHQAVLSARTWWMFSEPCRMPKLQSALSLSIKLNKKGKAMTSIPVAR